MKIQKINNYINYNGNTKPVKHEELIKNKNYDVIEINKDNVNKDKMSGNISEKVKDEITSQIKKETSSEKINRIKESIDNNTYQIDVDEIVKRLLDK
nr:flagellar biosynthesis anti-sigma factor FlgM [Sedimentibacter sp.]